jgi:hypothetical protein
MKRGFMNFVTTRIIPDFPGHTALWYAKEYLESFSDGSDAENKVRSLANTLSKQVQTGREKRIRRERIDGVYCFFPVSSKSSSGEDIVTQFSLSNDEIRDIDNLVAVDKFRNRSDAIKWLVTEGIKANRVYLNKVASTRHQIEQLKRDV